MPGIGTLQLSPPPPSWIANKDFSILVDKMRHKEISETRRKEHLTLYQDKYTQINRQLDFLTKYIGKHIDEAIGNLCGDYDEERTKENRNAVDEIINRFKELSYLKSDNTKIYCLNLDKNNGIMSVKLFPYP